MRQFKLDCANGSAMMCTVTLLIISLLYIFNPSAASFPSSLSEVHSSQEAAMPTAPRLEPTSSGFPPSRLLKVRPPPLPYMMDLYNQYQSGQIRNYRKHNNIIRSILPTRGKVSNDDILVFNLTAMRPSERLQRAELHIHNHHPMNDRKKSSTQLRMILFNMLNAPHVLTTVTDVKPTPGTQTLEITDSVSECIKDRKDGGRLLLGVKIEERNSKDEYKAIHKVRFRKLASQSFLTVFSKERSLGGAREVGIHSLDIVKARQKNISVPLSQEESVKPAKRKRSVADNELPDYPLHINDVIANASLESLRTWMSQGKLDSSIIPHPEVLKPRKPFGQQRKHRKKRRRKNRKLPEIWQQQPVRRRENDVRLKNDTESSPKGFCHRQKLVVDVADIGWNEWIISPQTFDVHFCAGVCRFPMSGRDQPSNHATLQSMVHAFGLYPNVPAPCCVPQSLSSITLLFFDEDYSVVLKNYPDMKVESCACR